MTKSQLRKEYKYKRANLSTTEIELYSAQILEKIKELPIWDKTYFHIFLSIIAQKEVATNDLIKYLYLKEKQVVVPKITADETQLMNCRLLPSTFLTNNKWNIPEPEFCRVVNAYKIEVIFIPLLISDINGNRIGYGKGFYDKLLASCSKEVIKVGLNFFEPINQITNLEQTDIPLNYLVTPQKIYNYLM